jgi:hypothetical protein
VFWVEVRGGQKKAVARSDVFRNLCDYRAILMAKSGIHNKRCIVVPASAVKKVPARYFFRSADPAVSEWRSQIAH